MRIRKHYRLCGAEEIKLLFTKGKRIESPLFRIIFRENALSHARFLFVTPKAIEKRAVARNRIRRRAREWLYGSSVPQLSLDVALVFKKDAIKSPRKFFYEELSRKTAHLPALTARNHAS